MPTIVGILTFISRINFSLSWSEHGKSLITLGPGPVCKVAWVRWIWEALNLETEKKLLARGTKDLALIMIWAPAWEKQQSALAKTKTQISFAFTAKLISAFVFSTRIVQFLFLNSKFPASNRLMWLYSPAYVGPGQNPNCWFSHAQTYLICCFKSTATVMLGHCFHFIGPREQWPMPLPPK